jgi:predicted proteasome-type protease
MSRDGFKALTVVQDKGERVSNQILAQEIRAIAQGVRTLLDSGLTEDAIVVLVKNAIPDSYGISEKTVRTVIIHGLGNLEKKYLKGGK